MAAPSPFSAETLLEHEHFVRAVARGLLGDADAAGDVLQETWLRTLQRGPRAGGNLRAWLARVAGNLARDRRRGSTRRALREERAARSEAAESVDTAFERVSLQRDVATAILALDEPYRSVVLLRYYHGLEPSEVAARLGTKPATVRTQLVRAHEILRARLDSRYGRETWAALLLPVAGVTRSAVSLGAASLGLAAAAALGGLWLFARRGPARGEPSTIEVAAIAPAAKEAPRQEPAARVAAAPEAAPVKPSAAEVLPMVASHGTLETLAPRAELFASGYYDDRTLATFSFQHGLRDDPTNIVGEDRDVEYRGADFGAHVRENGTSVIVDLGDLRVRTLWSWRGELGAARERAPVEAGHTYFLWSRDPDTDLAIAFEVLELEPGNRCVLEWYATADGRTARASFRDESPGTRLAQRLIELRSELRRPGELVEPRVQLQVRSGEALGNWYRVDMAGGLTWIFQRASEPLDLRSPRDPEYGAVAFSRGGFVPEGRVFVVTRATWWCHAPKDPNRDSRFALVVGGEPIVTIEGSDSDSGTWTGRIEVPPGEEALTHLELHSRAAGEAELFGEWVERPGLLARARPSPPRKPRAPRPPPTLEQPRAELQGRNGSGGDDIRLRLDGSTSRDRKRAEAPLDLDAPIGERDHGIVHCEGGVLPAGEVFVVTRVDYRGRVSDDVEGDARFAIVVAGERILEHEARGPISGTWTGRLEIEPRGEKRTYLELLNSSVGEAILTGEFVRR